MWAISRRFSHKYKFLVFSVLFSCLISSYMYTLYEKQKELKRLLTEKFIAYLLLGAASEKKKKKKIRFKRNESSLLLFYI